MTEAASLKATVDGHVQGVCFRAFVAGWAGKLGVAGYVRNLPGGAVEVQAEGERKRLEELADYLRLGPPAARVEKVMTVWSEYTGNYSGFKVSY